MAIGIMTLPSISKSLKCCRLHVLKNCKLSLLKSNLPASWSIYDFLFDYTYSSTLGRVTISLVPDFDYMRDRICNRIDALLHSSEK